MGKISPVSIKYVIHANIRLSGAVEKPDVIGAVFGQTEGLLGSELELRELQKSGRIGRIEVDTTVSNGKSEGEIIIPSSMGKSETAIIAAAIETIERVGPCTAQIHVKKIEDVRISKRDFIISRAKELLKLLVDDMPDSQAITNSITEDVRALEITEYGKERLPAGPMIKDSEELIIVEGRADVVNMLKYGFKNIIGMGGANPSEEIIDLIKTKIVTLFVDGDRGGDLILKNMSRFGELDFVARAPDGKEVEELTLKEINKSLRAKMSWEQLLEEGIIDRVAAKADHAREAQRDRGESSEKAESQRESRERPERESRSRYDRRSPREDIRRDSRGRDSRDRRDERPRESKPELSKSAAKVIKQMSEELVGTHGAYLVDEGTNILGKVPVKELASTIKDMGDGIYAVVLDGAIDPDLINLAERNKIKFLIAKKAEGRSMAVTLLSSDSL